MKIVIDIPDEQYKRICDHTDGVRVYDMISLLTIIENGTSLPKGHGRLIDADVIKDFKDRIKCYKEDYAFSQKEILNILERYEIKYALPIIESDKGSD